MDDNISQRGRVGIDVQQLQQPVLQKVGDQNLGWAGGGDGPDAFQGGEDQSSGGPVGALLGYLVWRDPKAALLMFIRKSQASAPTSCPYWSTPARRPG
ncbi:hypothetical protein ACWDA3_40600 [Nonomuraea rubra]